MKTDAEVIAFVNRLDREVFKGDLGISQLVDLRVELFKFLEDPNVVWQGEGGLATRTNREGYHFAADGELPILEGIYEVTIRDIGGMKAKVVRSPKESENG
jgi:hypothetical protein